MLQSEANWRFIETENGLIDGPEENAPKLSPVIKELLLQRGITSIEQAKEFLNPQLTSLHKSSQFQSIEKACKRVYQAIEKREKILVYGDYRSEERRVGNKCRRQGTRQ